VIWGASGHAKVLLDVLREPGYELAAFIDNDPDAVSPVDGVKVYAGEDGLATWLARAAPGPAAAVAIGGGRLLAAAGCELLTVVHPTAYVADSAGLGAGAQVLAHACVAVDCRLGEGTIVNTSASVDHECALGDGVHVGPGAILAGLVTAGDGAFVGAGAVVLPRIRIGSRSKVGAGAVVTRDVPDGALVYGNPASVRAR
jgi:sugar O-acyltransferase (sialic acid O-acetyltransferase NeuD family)